MHERGAELRGGTGVSRTLEKVRRRQAILALLEGKAIPSQHALARALRGRGFRVTQATLSRDLKELRVSRVPSEKGYAYAVAESEAPEPEVSNLAEQEVVSIDANEHMIVVRTLAGRAQGVGVYIDGLQNADILGTLAGDDTVLVLPRRVRRTPQLRAWLQELFGFET